MEELKVQQNKPRRPWNKRRRIGSILFIGVCVVVVATAGAYSMSQAFGGFGGFDGFGPIGRHESENNPAVVKARNDATVQMQNELNQFVTQHIAMPSSSPPDTIAHGISTHCSEGYPHRLIYPDDFYMKCEIKIATVVRLPQANFVADTHAIYDSVSRSTWTTVGHAPSGITQQVSPTKSLYSTATFQTDNLSTYERTVHCDWTDNHDAPNDFNGINDSTGIAWTDTSGRPITIDAVVGGLPDDQYGMQISLGHEYYYKK